MIDILIINHTTQNCGVYQFGRRVADLAIKTNLNIQYRELESPDEYNKLLNELKPRMVLINWYPITMGWLSDDLLRDNIKNYFLFHDGHIRTKYDKYVFNGSYEKPDSIRIAVDRKLLLPRPLFNYETEHIKNDVTTVGSFGFGFWHKGFPDVVTKVNQEFSEAIINLHIPHGHFGDAEGEQSKEVIAECYRRNINSNIKLNITTEMLDDNQLLNFLAKNDLNCFFYGSVNEGLSSVIDYALSVKRPIGLTDNMMFRHILSDDIIIEKNNLQDIISKGTKPLDKFYELWSVNEFVKQFEEIFTKELND